MKIPLHLAQFKEEDALLLVTGKQDAVIYRAAKGIMEKLDSFKIPRPHFSDNEGGFGRTQGSAKEIRDEDIIRDFMHELKIRLKKLGADSFSVIYLFTPSEVKNRIKNALPTNLRNNIKLIVEGNFFRFAPIDLLVKIS